MATDGEVRPQVSVPGPRQAQHADAGDAAAQAWQQLRDRAFAALDLAVTFSDARRPDSPLVYANRAFTRITGYEQADVVGRNCRFLQGEGTEPTAVAELREGIAAQRQTTVTLLNYRADGTPFWNQVSVSPVTDDDGLLVGHVGVQVDVTARVEAEQEREREFTAERQARMSAETAQARLALLAEATSLLTATFDVDVAMQGLADLVVPRVADWCAIDRLLPDGSRSRVAVAHVSPEKAELVRRLADPEGGYLQRPDTLLGRVFERGRPVLLEEVAPVHIKRATASAELREVWHRLEPRSGMVVPLRAREQVLGALTLVAAESDRRFGADDLALAEDLGRRAALALDNARLYHREHAVAETLQRSLLPALPVVPGLELAARYLPGRDGAQVGGDWWDVLPLPDGATGLAIGDVMGHDMAAAAAMGQLRSVLRSYAWEGDRPASVLDRLDRLVQGFDSAALATAVYARVESTGPEGPVVLRWANAGHLPPLLQDPDGQVRLLEDAGSILVGAPSIGDRPEAAAELPSGATLLLYTDGLLERRGEGIDEGLDRLQDVVRGHDPEAGPEALCRRLVERLASSGLDDDVALLAVRVR